MLTVLMKPNKAIMNEEKAKQIKNNSEIRDVIVKQKSKKTEYNENGDEITKTVTKTVNITKLVNETKKLVKNTNAEDKLAELEKILSK